MYFMIVVLAVLAAFSTDLVEMPKPTTSMLTGDVTKAVAASAVFCASQPSECSVNPDEPEFINLDAGAWRKLREVNRLVNRLIRPMEDQKHWGKVDVWGFPEDGFGDCEDYQLLKRKILVDGLGFPRRALRMTVVVDTNGSGHAVMMVRTDRGDFLLDNLANEVLAWDHTPYSFSKREGAVTGEWVFLLDPVDRATATADKAR